MIVFFKVFHLLMISYSPEGLSLILVHLRQGQAFLIELLVVSNTLFFKIQPIFIYI